MILQVSSIGDSSQDTGLNYPPGKQVVHQSTRKYVDTVLAGSGISAIRRPMNRNVANIRCTHPDTPAKS